MIQHGKNWIFVDFTYSWLLKKTICSFKKQKVVNWNREIKQNCFFCKLNLVNIRYICTTGETFTVRLYSRDSSECYCWVIWLAGESQVTTTWSSATCRVYRTPYTDWIWINEGCVQTNEAEINGWFYVVQSEHRESRLSYNA